MKNAKCKLNTMKTKKSRSCGCRLRWRGINQSAKSVSLIRAIWQRLLRPTRPPPLIGFLPVLGKNPHPLKFYLPDCHFLSNICIRPPIFALRDMPVCTGECVQTKVRSSLRRSNLHREGLTFGISQRLPVPVSRLRIQVCLLFYWVYSQIANFAAKMFAQQVYL